MIQVHLRFTLVPTKKVGNRLHFAAFVTPVVTEDTNAPKPVPLTQDGVLDKVLWNWPSWIDQMLVKSRFTVKLSDSQGLPIQRENGWCRDVEWKLPHPSKIDAMPTDKALDLWHAILGDGATVQPEPAAEANPGATKPRMNVDRADTGKLANAPADQSRRAVDLVADAAQKNFSTVEGLTSNVINKEVGRFLAERAAGVSYPGADKTLRGKLEEYGFLLGRQERLGSAGRASDTTTVSTKPTGGTGLDFHQLVSSLGDHPYLLRALGLVFDFSVKKPDDELLGPVVPDAGPPPDPGRRFFFASVTLDVPDEDKATVVQAGATDRTACQLTTRGVFTPRPRSGSELEANATLYRRECFDTVQWDIFAALRACIREKDSPPPPPAAAVPPPAPSAAAAQAAPPPDDTATAVDLRPFPGLVSHGIVLFHRTASLPEVVQSALSQEHRTEMDAPGVRTHDADDLARGYRIEVCRTGHPGGAGGWSGWKQLSARSVTYTYAQDQSLVYQPLFSTPDDDFGTISLALTAGMQPLSGWLLGPLDLFRHGEGDIALTAEELENLGASATAADSPRARCYLLATHNGTVVVADAPDADDLAAWHQQRTVDAKAKQPVGPLETFVRQTLAAGLAYVYGGYVDLQGFPAPAAGKDNRDGLFLVRGARLASAEGGFGVAGTVVGTPETRPGQPANGANPPAAPFSESVVRIRRYTEAPPTAAASNGVYGRTQETFIHLRAAAPANAPLSGGSGTDSFGTWVGKLPSDRLQAGGKAKEDALFIQAQGELALTVFDLKQVHVPNFHRRATTAGGEEIGELELEYRGGAASGRAGFVLHDPASGGSDTLLPLNLDLPANVPIQTLTRAAATVDQLTPGTLLRAALRRQGDGTITVLSLTEITTAAEVTIQGFQGADVLLITSPGSAQPLPVEVLPLGTVVEFAEPGPPAGAAGSATADDSGFTAAAGQSYVRGPWAEHGMHVQIGDRCRLDLLPNGPGAATRYRATRITVSLHDDSRALLGYFQDDAGGRDESTLAFTAVRSAADAGAGSPPAAPALLSVTVDDSTRVYSGPVMKNSPWRFFQLPPANTLVKLFLDASVTPSAANPSKSPKALAVEVLSGVQGTLYIDMRDVTAPDWERLRLAVPGFVDPVAFRLADPLAAQLQTVFPDASTLARFPVGLNFQSAQVAGTLQITATGWVTPTDVVDGVQRYAVRLQTSDMAAFTVTLTSHLADGRIPSPDELVEMSIQWFGDETTLPAMEVTRTVAPLVRLQIASVDAALRRLEVVVVFRRGPGAALRAGTRAALYAESGADPDPWAYLLPRLQELRDSGMPLDLEAQETLVVDATPGVSTDNRKLHQWSLFAWPVADDALQFPAANPTDKKSWPPTSVRKDSPCATLWAHADKPYFFPQAGAVDRSAFRLVAGHGAQAATWKPLLGPAVEIPVDAPERAGLPDGIHSFLPDQMVVDDSIAHWSGRSLAVGLPGKPGLGERPDPVRRGLKVTLALHNGVCMPLRFGRYYAFRVRPVYLTGDCPDPQGSSAPHAILFRPFGDCLPDDDGRPLPFLRLEPLSAPRAGWTTRARQKGLAKRDGWGDPSDVRLLTSGPATVSCPASQRAHRLAPELELSAPEAPFRLAELGGLLDAMFALYATSPAGDNLPGIDDLYRDLQALDEPVPENFPPGQDPDHRSDPGFVPERLPDPDADRPVLELRPANTGTVLRYRLADLPGFGSSPRQWVKNLPRTGYRRYARRLRVLSAPEAAVGPSVAVEDGVINVYLPANMECEMVLRSAPPTACNAPSRLALIRLLETSLLLLQTHPGVSPASVVPYLSGADGLPGDLKDKIARALADAHDGFHPLISSGAVVRLRHMTDRPASPPHLVSPLRGVRLPGATSVVLEGQYRIDRPSTGALLIQSALEMPYDDAPGTALPRVPREELKAILAPEFLLPAPTPPPTADFHGFASDGRRAILSGEFTITQLKTDAPPPIPTVGGNLENLRHTHDLGDCLHHTVFYRPLAVSRFKDFFGDTARLNPCPHAVTRPTDEELRWLENPPPPPDDVPPRLADAMVPWERVEILATARPHPPVVRDQVIVYQWQPSWSAPEAAWSGWTFERTRQAGVRVWLDRPWYSSGSGEKLAVLCWGKTAVGAEEVERYLRTVSRWGTDPVFEAAPGADMNVLTRDDFLFTEKEESPAGLPVPRAGTPEGSAAPLKNATPTAPAPTPSATVTPQDGAAEPDATLALAVYQPVFHPDAQLWYCDIFVDPCRYTPFVSLSIARYQPFALPGCAVSVAVRLDPMQIYPPRKLRIKATFQDTLQIDVTLSGILPPDKTRDYRLVLCRVQRYTGAPSHEGNPSAGLSDLEWADLPLSDSNHRPFDPAKDPAGAAVAGARKGLPGLRLAPKHDDDDQAEPSFHRLVEVPVVTGPDRWEADTVLRVVVLEYEVFPTAYALTEGRTWAPRLIYADEATLPQALVQRIVQSGS